MRILLAAWVALHLAAHLVTVWQDVPVLAHAVATLPPGTTPRFAPVQVGGHYASWPRLPGEPCLLEPVWIWSASQIPVDLSTLRADTARMLGQPAAGTAHCQSRPARVVTWHPGSETAWW